MCNKYWNLTLANNIWFIDVICNQSSSISLASLNLERRCCFIIIILLFNPIFHSFWFKNSSHHLNRRLRLLLYLVEYYDYYYYFFTVRFRCINSFALQRIYIIILWTMDNEHGILGKHTHATHNNKPLKIVNTNHKNHLR